MREATPAGTRPRAWLAPLGALFGGAAALRVALYRRGVLGRTRLRSPVISIGNLAVGGRGKTPLVALSARVLREAGRPVAVLSRGYGGAFGGEALVVSDGRQVLADAALAGDEPVMLARALPGVVVAVGPDRSRVAAAVEERLGARVHLLDDGFQHLRLWRDLDVVCLDAGDLAQRPLPAGPLRERPRALARADMVVVQAEDAADLAPTLETLARFLPVDRLFRAVRRPDGLFDLTGNPSPPPARVFVLTGIARPGRVVSDLTTEGMAVAGHAAFPDHHRYSAGDLAEVARRARAAGATAIVTTAKDAVRLPSGAGDLPILVFRVRCEVEDGDRFRQRLLAASERG